MLPIRDDNPTEITPFLTVILILANVAAWFLLQGAGTEAALVRSVEAFGTQPCEITGNCPTQGLGWETVVTSMFMHGGWMHLLGNMLFLWVFGNNIEDSMGHVRFLVFYLACGVAASLAHVYLSPLSRVPAVGASGAISGIMGAYIVLYPRASVRTWVPPFWIFDLNAFFFLAYWFVLQLFGGFTAVATSGGREQGGVAFWAHVGGFVAGLVLIKIFEKPRLVDAKRRKVHLSREEVARLEW